MDYFYRVVGGAGRDTLAVLGGGTAFWVSLAITIVALAIIYKWLGPKEMKAELRIATAIGGAFVFVGTVFFVANILMFTPMRLYTEESDKRTGLERDYKDLSDTRDDLKDELVELRDELVETGRENRNLRLGIEERQRQINQFYIARAEEGRQEKPEETGGRTATTAGVVGVEPPASEQLRYTTSEITSPHDDAPYGLQLTIQTNVKMNGIVLNIHCSGPVHSGGIMAGANYTGIMVSGTEVVPGQPNVLAANMKSPAFLPERPLLVRIYSSERISITRLVYQKL